LNGRPGFRIVVGNEEVAMMRCRLEVVIALALVGCGGRSSYNEALHNYTMEVQLLDRLEKMDRDFDDKFEESLKFERPDVAERERTKWRNEGKWMDDEIAQQRERVKAARKALDTHRPKL
jgi:hypothetical protein